MGWLIGIGVLQLIVLGYIAYCVERTVKEPWLGEALEVILQAIRASRNSN